VRTSWGRLYALVYAKQVWDALTDESQGVGRELYEAVYDVRERLGEKAGAGVGAKPDR
jgi:hypothetical protein